MAGRPGHRFNVQEYYRLAEIGVIPPGARVELLNGKIIDQDPINPFHAGLNKCLIRIYSELAWSRWLVASRSRLRLEDHSEPEPDFMLLKPSPDDYTNRHPRPDEVFLLIEVSDTTLDYDREDKLPAYGRAGIVEVWIVNLTNTTIEVYRDPHFTGYGSKVILSSGDQIAPQAFPDAMAEVVELLKR